MLYRIVEVSKEIPMGMFINRLISDLGQTVSYRKIRHWKRLGAKARCILQVKTLQSGVAVGCTVIESGPNKGMYRSAKRVDMRVDSQPRLLNRRFICGRLGS